MNIVVIPVLFVDIIFPLQYPLSYVYNYDQCYVFHYMY